MPQQRSLTVPAVPSFAVFAKLLSLFALLAAISAADLVFRGLRRYPWPEQSPVWSLPGGDAERGAGAIRRHGCAACHVIPGIRHAMGAVGPNLNAFRNQVYIAGRLPNSPENLMAWIKAPHSIDPDTAMPDLNVTDADARDMAAYLHSYPQ